MKDANEIQVAPQNNIQRAINFVYEGDTIEFIGSEQKTKSEGIYVNDTKLSDTDISSALSQWNSELVTNYKKYRAQEYPAWEEQADMLYWDRINSTTKLDELISGIKEKYPKG